MKRFLLLLSLLISGFLILIWEISSPENLPTADTEWHLLKRKVAMKLLCFKKDPFSNDHIPLSNEKIDIVILAIEKDMPTLPFAIDAAKALIMHTINKIYLICPESEKLRAIATEKGCEFVEESKTLPVFASEHSLTSHLKQQYLMLNAENVTDKGVKYYLVIDANTILLQTQTFLKNQKQVLHACNGYDLRRKQIVESALNLGKYLNLDLTSHYMFFDKKLLQSMKARLEKLHGKSWQDALINYDNSHTSAYAMYANYMLNLHPDQVMIVHEKNICLPADKVNGIEWQRGFLSSRYKSVSFCNLATNND